MGEFSYDVEEYLAFATSRLAVANGPDVPIIMALALAELVLDRLLDLLDRHGDAIVIAASGRGSSATVELALALLNAENGILYLTYRQI